MSKMCYDDCQVTARQKASGSIKCVNCIGCMKLFHIPCVEKKESLGFGTNMITYNCMVCRSMSKDVGKILNELSNIREMLDGRIKKCDELVAEKEKLMIENVKLNSELEKLNSELEKMKQGQAGNFRRRWIKPGNSEEEEQLLLGSSIVRDFHDTKGLKVTSIGGAGIQRIEDEVDKSDIKDYKKVTVEAASIDCAEINITSGVVLDRYEKLIAKLNIKKVKPLRLKLQVFFHKPKVKKDNKSLMMSTVG